MRSFLDNKTQRITEQIDILLNHKIDELLIFFTDQLKKLLKSEPLAPHLLETPLHFDPLDFLSDFLDDYSRFLLALALFLLDCDFVDYEETLEHGRQPVDQRVYYVDWVGEEVR